MFFFVIVVYVVCVCLVTCLVNDIFATCSVKHCLRSLLLYCKKYDAMFCNIVVFFSPYDPFHQKRYANIELQQLEPAVVTTNEELHGMDRNLAVCSLFGAALDGEKEMEDFIFFYFLDARPLGPFNSSLVSSYQDETSVPSLDWYPLRECNYVDCLNLNVYRDVANKKPFEFVGFVSFMAKLHFRLRSV